MQKQIAAAKAKLAALEKKAAVESSKKLANLHKTVGFATRGELVSALQGLSSVVKRAPKAKTPKAKKVAKAPKAPKTPKAPKAPKAEKVPKAVKAPEAVKAAGAPNVSKRAKRARITEELKANVIAAVKDGGKGAAIAKQFGISIPSLQNIKKAAGLTKPRGK